MREIKAIIRPERLLEVLRALHATAEPAGRDDLDGPRVWTAIAAASRADLRRSQDDKIFVVPVEHAVKVRSGE